MQHFKCLTQPPLIKALLDVGYFPVFSRGEFLIPISYSLASVVEENDSVLVFNLNEEQIYSLPFQKISWLGTSNERKILNWLKLEQEAHENAANKKIL